MGIEEGSQILLVDRILPASYTVCSVKQLKSDMLHLNTIISSGLPAKVLYCNFFVYGIC